MLNFSDIKVGDTLKDRDGDEHRVFAVVPAIGKIVTGWGTDFANHNTWDVDDYFVEKLVPKKAMYVNVYDSAMNGVEYSRNASREEADRAAGRDRVACVRVEYVPGQMDE